MTKACSVFKQKIYLGAATRTPIGKFGGRLKHFSASQLASICLKEACQRAPDSITPDYVIMGHARQAGCGPNPARQASILAELPDSVPALTVNQACASGLASVIGAVEKICSGKARSGVGGRCGKYEQHPLPSHERALGK